MLGCLLGQGQRVKSGGRSQEGLVGRTAVVLLVAAAGGGSGCIGVPSHAFPCSLAPPLLPRQVVTTISRGRLVWHEGKLNVTRGSGRFVPTPPFGPLFDGLDHRPEHLVDVARYGGVPVKRAGDGAAGHEEL